MAFQHFKHDLRANHWSGPKALVAPLLSPAVLLLLLHRTAARLRRVPVVGKPLALLTWRLNTLLTTCHVNPRCTIGGGLFLPHPASIVIGERVRIGSNVTIYQSVTLGTSVPDSLAYPIVEDGVTIYAGAVIVGAVNIGRGAIIGANAFVNTDVAAGSVFAGVPAREVPRRAAR
ncbi:hypothetical protein C1925_19560 [Stenotrophomonas sp. SAU14A_NAIMI4_5]|uniref:serine O-acetyltransferase n=1 Tax=Stenotrophomonas sp. SAU14A_NAIMI4_5 TaxID=2072413 RepID=UPI000D53DDBF|nr:serine acetyltransferase [Stenotrophomonas sp. SAU14A_NAIMI4_5]AWH51206.1 hypothetical protein C1925_19560 [Stenotrophomonas sp. SAU14A_NAIMI4_5]